VILSGECGCDYDANELPDCQGSRGWNRPIHPISAQAFVGQLIAHARQVYSLFKRLHLFYGAPVFTLTDRGDTYEVDEPTAWNGLTPFEQSHFADHAGEQAMTNPMDFDASQWPKMVITAPADLRIRTGPGTEYPTLMFFGSDTVEARVSPTPTRDAADKFDWYAFEATDPAKQMRGWFADVNVRLTPVDEPEPPLEPDEPVPPSDSITLDRWLIIVKAQRDLYAQYANSAAHMRDMLQEEADRLEGLLNAEE
jgi:hypothetical protein